MIMKYRVEITETLKRTVEVEAENKLEALAKIKADYDDEIIVLCADDYEETYFEVK